MFLLSLSPLLFFQEVNGGVLNVADGGRVRFKDSVYMHDVEVRSVTGEDTDFTTDMWFGGCIYNSVRLCLPFFRKSPLSPIFIYLKVTPVRAYNAVSHPCALCSSLNARMGAAFAPTTCR